MSAGVLMASLLPVRGSIAKASTCEREANFDFRGASARVLKTCRLTWWVRCPRYWESLQGSENESMNRSH